MTLTRATFPIKCSLTILCLCGEKLWTVLLTIRWLLAKLSLPLLLVQWLRTEGVLLELDVLGVLTGIEAQVEDDLTVLRILLIAILRHLVTLLIPGECRSLPASPLAVRPIPVESLRRWCGMCIS